MFTLYAAIEKHLLKNTKLYVAFIDFKKAYDTVNRDILWMVLFRSGVRGKMLRMIRGIYATVQACVMSKLGLSDFFECFQGLKQGCILSPILFSMLINELANEILEKGKHGVSLGPAEIELFSASVCGRPYFTFIDCNWATKPAECAARGNPKVRINSKLRQI